jgi:O-antigen/teichoic acid export membrane protein
VTDVPSELAELGDLVVEVEHEPPGGVAGRVRAYAAANVLSQLIAALSVPLFARRLGPAGFGELEILTVVLSLVISACGDAFSSGFLKLWFDEGVGVDRRVLVQTTRRLAATLALLAGAVGAGIAWSVSDLDSAALVATVIAAVASVLARTAAEVLRAQGRAWRYVIATAGRSFAAAALAVVGLVVLSPSAAVVMYASVAGAVIAFLYATAAGRYEPGNVRHTDGIGRRLWRISWPLVPAAISAWSLMLVDRFVLSWLEGNAAVGEYGAANRVVAALFLFPYAVTAAWIPHALQLAASDPEAEPAARNRLLPELVTITSLGAVALSAISEPLVRVALGREFLPAAGLVPVLSLGVVFFAAVSPLQVPLLVAERTKAIASCSVVAAAVNVVAAIALVARYGTMGAAAATVVGFAVLAIGFLLLAQKTAPSAGAWARSLQIWVPASVALVAQSIVIEHSGPFVSTLAIGLAFPIVLWITGVRFRPMYEHLSKGRT